MDPPCPKRTCNCARSSLQFSSALLFLSIVLPQTSFAQLSDVLPPSAGTSTPTTLSPSIVQSSSSSSSPTHAANSTQPPPPSNAPPAAAGPQGEEPTHNLNYYFLVIAAAAIAVCICILYLGRRKKRKAVLARSLGQNALRADVENLRRGRSRFGMGRNVSAINEIHARNGREEGLDERGEAPPPYLPGSKPPSIREGDGIGGVGGIEPGRGEVVELARRSWVPNTPPGYDSLVSRNAAFGISRPEPVAVTHETSGLMI